MIKNCKVKKFFNNQSTLHYVLTLHINDSYLGFPEIVSLSSMANVL